MLCYYCSESCENKFCSIRCVGKAQKAQYKNKYDSNPKLYQHRHNTFCNKSCAARYNNCGRIRSNESKLKTSNSLINRNKKCILNWDWQAIQEYYNNDHSIRECEHRFSISFAVWNEAKKQGLFITRSPKLFNLLGALTENSTATRKQVKKHLIQSSLLENKCFECSHESEWNGKKLVLVLDHKNGINNDNRLENLRLLCPNCNSQTETFAGKNKARRVNIGVQPLLVVLD